MGEHDFVKVGLVSEVPLGKMKMVRVGENEILVANVEGTFYAVANRCTHMGGDLSKGTLEGKTVTCPRHGSKFDLTTGRTVSGPKILFVRLSTKDLQRYDIKVEVNDILVRI